MKFQEHEYIGFDPCDGDRDVNLRCQSAKIVKVRKPHTCHLSLIDGKEHSIKPGELARCEKVIFEEKWESYYCCIPCIDAWFIEIGMVPDGYFKCVVCEDLFELSQKNEIDDEEFCGPCFEKETK